MIKLNFKRIVIIGIGVLVVSGIYIHHLSGEADDPEASSRIMNTIEEKYPDETEKLRQRFGLKPFETETVESRQKGPCAVILIHGLDDPGKVWMSLAPALDQKGFDVWIMTYPNDQHIKVSAEYFFEQIKLNTALKGKKLAIVGHSMGGLVTREMLTSPEIQYINYVTENTFPQVLQVIMVGTPNHGSNMARFRVFAELREQFALVLKGEYHWISPFIDGTGEAGDDLLPDSEFLLALNSRKHPDDVEMTVIAGVMNQKQRENAKQTITDLTSGLSKKHKESIKKMISETDAIINQVGDGMVPLSSAKLDGVPTEIVSGTHLSIIRNISYRSDRIPPAVPIIIRLLNETACRPDA